MSVSATAWLAPDTALPQRDVLLDAAAAADRIARPLGGGRLMRIDGCERLRVNYQIGKSLRVVYRVDAAGASWTISARAFREGRGQRAYQEARDASTSCAGVPPVFYDAAVDTVFWVFPNDRKLAGLAAVSSGDSSVSEGLPLAWQSTRLVAYAPEKSATLACLDDRRAIIAYAKVSAHDQSEHDFHRYRALEALVNGRPFLRFPRALGYMPRLHLLHVEAIAGRRMDDPTGEHATEDAAGFGAALATLHSLPPVEAPALTRFAPDRLVVAQRLVVRVRPDVEGLVDALAGELISRRPAEDDAPVCLHGDVHPKNAIVTGREVALIDVEDLAIGPVAADVGSFLAGLFYLRRGGRLSAGKHREVTRAFLSGYASVRPLPPRPTLRWYTSAALLIERILRSVNRVRPLGLVHLPDLLRDARALLTDGTDDALEP